MSIITEALKKVERHRKQKELQKAQKAGTQGAKTDDKSKETSEGVIQSIVGAILGQRRQATSYVNPQGGGLTVAQPFSFPFWSDQEMLVLSSIVFFIAFVLFLLPRWPTVHDEYTIEWRLFSKPIEWSFFSNPLSSTNVVLDRASGKDVDRMKSRFRLSGISEFGGGRYAVIDNKIVQENGTINGALVKTISNTDVTLETRTREIKLKLYS